MLFLEDIFLKKNVIILPEHHSFDCAINLEERVHPHFGPIYNLSQTELARIMEVS